MKRSFLLLISFFTLFIATSCSSEEQKPRNIILLIGDGMSFAHIQSGILAIDGPTSFDEFRHIGFIHTSSADDFVTDSGAAGTALASGVKTNNNAIGIDANGNPVRSILQIASDNGLSTGMVVTCALTHATPAAFIAHQRHRNMGEEIALDFLSTPVDVIIGGGRNHFERRRDGRNLVEELKNKGYQVAFTMDEVHQVQSGKLAGFLAANHLPRMTEGRGDMLPESVEATINILNQNSAGFFLMVEGSQIDWGGHDNDIEYIVTETVDFEQAIARALEFAKSDGETLVIVTSDHDTGGLALHGFDPQARQITAGFTTGGHTGLIQPVMAWGPGAEKFGGIYENTGVFDRMLEAFGFSSN